MTVAIEGAGTPEAIWRTWLEAQRVENLQIASWRGARVTVLAAHPDDEVLGVGEILSQLHDSGARLRLVWATDGEASHPGSTAMSRRELAARRRREARHALAVLGIDEFEEHHCGLPDGGLARREDLTSVVRPFITDADLVFAPWRHDGHPDHEALGAVAAAADPRWLLEYPIWMWHWAMPGDARVPWSRCRVVPVADYARKRRAIDEFATQVRPLGPRPEDAAILPAAVIERFVRPFELVIA